MDRGEILAQLKEKHIVYGSKYTVQCAYLWEKGDELLELKNKEPSNWSVCKNHQIDVYEDGTRFELCPVPIETFEADEMEKAADRFIELEYGKAVLKAPKEEAIEDTVRKVFDERDKERNKKLNTLLRNAIIFIAVIGIGFIISMVLMAVITDCLLY